MFFFVYLQMSLTDDGRRESILNLSGRHMWPLQAIAEALEIGADTRQLISILRRLFTAILVQYTRSLFSCSFNDIHIGGSMTDNCFVPQEP